MADQNTTPTDTAAAPAPVPVPAGHVRVRVMLGYQLVDDATGEKTHRLAGEVRDIPEDEAHIEAQRNRVQIVDPTTPLAEPTYPSTNPPQVE